MSNFSLASEQLVFAYSKCHCLESKTSKLKNCLQKKQKFCWFFSYFFFYSKTVTLFAYFAMTVEYAYITVSHQMCYHTTQKALHQFQKKNLFSCSFLQTMVKFAKQWYYLFSNLAIVVLLLFLFIISSYHY